MHLSNLLIRVRIGFTTRMFGPSRQLNCSSRKMLTCVPTTNQIRNYSGKGILKRQKCLIEAIYGIKQEIPRLGKVGGGGGGERGLPTMFCSLIGKDIIRILFFPSAVLRKTFPRRQSLLILIYFYIYYLIFTSASPETSCSLSCVAVDIHGLSCRLVS